MGESEQTVVKATTGIEWRKLLLPFVFIMVLPSIAALLLDLWLGSLPLITIAAILICFPLATFLVMRKALKEMNRVIAEVAPPRLPDSETPELEPDPEIEVATVAPSSPTP